MNLLMIDTSGPVAGVCVLKNGSVAYEAAAVSGRTHSESILPMVEEALNRCGMTPDQIDLFGCVTGPGSFTGVRIGVSLVKGLAHGAGAEVPNCLGVDALEAMAGGFPVCDCLLCPIQDARAGQVYGAAFLPGMPPVRVLDDQAIALEAFVSICREKAQGKKLLFTGDGVKPNLAFLQSLPDAVLPPENALYLRPASAALVAWSRREETVDFLSLMPVYLRPPQAVRLRDRLSGGKA